MRASPSLHMQASPILRSSRDPKNGMFLGGWGDLGSQPQKGVVTYALSANRQKPLAGTLHAAVFNTARRTKGQILYWLPAMAIAYGVMEWASEKNQYYNSKPGRMALEEAGEEI